MDATCQNCRHWKPFDTEKWQGFGECSNPLFYLFKRDEKERLGRRFDRMSNIGDSAFGRDFGCNKFEALP